MGLACSQIRLLTLTQRKADCETDISLKSMRKMALTREMSELATEYNAKLRSSQICYYAAGSYNKVDYNYLMGSQGFAMKFYKGEDLPPLKNDYSMILTDYKGQVVLSNNYSNFIVKALEEANLPVNIDVNGRGGTFSPSVIPQIIANLAGLTSEEDINNIKSLIENDKLDTSTMFGYTSHKELSGKEGSSGYKDSSKYTQQALQNLIDFYYPIFISAASNGWTIEYNSSIKDNEDYISDALVSGTLHLETVNNAGEYDEGSSLAYFTTYKGLDTKTTGEKREEVTAWYNAEKQRINEEETWLDVDIQNLSTELESIKTEIQSVNSLIDDAISTVFDWGSK